MARCYRGASGLLSRHGRCYVAETSGLPEVVRKSAKSGEIPALSRNCDALREGEPGRLLRADGTVLG